MTALKRLKVRTGEVDEALLSELLESARAAILARRFPFGTGAHELEPRYGDLQVRIERRGHGMLLWHSAKEGLLYQLI